MYGLSKLMFPMLGHMIFNRNASSILMFIVAFGATKGAVSAFIGVASDECGRANLLRLGWVFGLPVFPLIMTATTWTQVIIANVLLGAHQGITWTISILIMLDLTAQRDRATIIGLNEFLGFFMVAIVTLLSSIQKNNTSSMGDFELTFWLGLAFTIFGLLVAIALPETLGIEHNWIVEHHDREFGRELDAEDELEAESEDTDAELWKAHTSQLERISRERGTSARSSPVASPTRTDMEASSILADEVLESKGDNPAASSSSSPTVVDDLTIRVPVGSAADELNENPHQRPTISMFRPAPLPNFANVGYLPTLFVTTMVNIWTVSFQSGHIFATWFSGYVTAIKEGVIWGLSPIFFKSYNLTVEQCGFLIGTYFVVLATAKVAVGYFADRGAGKMMVVGGLFVEIFGLLYYAWAPKLTLVDLPPQEAFGLFMLGSVVLGFGHACILPTLHHSMIQHVPREHQGSVLGVFRMWLGFGLCTGAGVGSALVGFYGFSVTFSIISVVVLAAAILLMIMMVDLPSQHSAKARQHFKAIHSASTPRPGTPVASPPRTAADSSSSSDEETGNAPGSVGGAKPRERKGKSRKNQASGPGPGSGAAAAAQDGQK